MTLENIKTFFDAAFLEAEIQNSRTTNRDLCIRDSGAAVLLKVDSERRRLVFFSAWPMKASAAELTKLQFINKLNDKLVLVRFSMPRPQTLWCDYYLTYVKGITPFTIVSTYRDFARAMKTAVFTMDTEKVMGKD